MNYFTVKNLGLLSLLAVFTVLQYPHYTQAQEMEIFTGDGAIPDFPKPQPENYLAKCMANPDDKISCYMAKNNKTDGGLESSVAGQLEISTFSICRENPGGVCINKSNGDDFAPAPQPVAAPVLRSVDIKIQFDYKKSSLQTKEYKKILQIATAFNDPINKSVRFAVIGHTDSKGGQSYNCGLSAKRAQSVRAALKDFGVAPHKLVFFGVGKSLLQDPVNSLSAKNRRVGFARLSGAEGAIIAKMKQICRQK